MPVHLEYPTSRYLTDAIVKSRSDNTNVKSRPRYLADKFFVFRQKYCVTEIFGPATQ